MKYVQPLGVVDTNASYVDGNPSTGTKGSAVPAASIENPQREIVNFIGASALTPTAADLFQLAKSVQAGLVNYGADQGTPNQIAVTLNPAVTAYTAGLRLIIKVAYANTNQVVINANAIGSVPLVHAADLTQLAGGELNPGQMIECVHDGAGHFQMLSGGAGGLILMTAPRDVYVDAGIGSDTLYDGSQATVSAPHGPFQTIQKALTTMTKYNLGGWTFTIHIADGIYASTTPIAVPGQNGSGSVVLLGNNTTPRNVIVQNSGTGSAMVCLNAGNFTLRGLSFQAAASRSGDPGNGVWWQGTGCNLVLDNCAFGAVPYAHIVSGVNASVSIANALTIYGSAQFSLNASVNAALLCSQPTNPSLAITVPVNITDFAMATDGAQTWPQFSTITGAGNVTGSKYYASGNGVIDSGGRGTSYLPGTVAGSLASGGQYL